MLTTKHYQHTINEERASEASAIDTEQTRRHVDEWNWEDDYRDTVYVDNHEDLPDEYFNIPAWDARQEAVDVDGKDPFANAVDVDEDGLPF